MKITKLLATVALSAVVSLSSSSYADGSFMEVVVDSSGNSVKDGFNGCVRHNFMVEKDNCSAVSMSSKADAVVYFDFDKSHLNSKAEKDLKEFVSKQKDKMDSVKSFEISGYTDRIGSNEYNMKLSQKRADAVAKYMKKLGVKADPVESGRGVSMVTKDACDNMKHQDKIKCLQPDRRADVFIQYNNK